MIRGNIIGIKKTYIKLLDSIFEIETYKNNIVNQEIIDIICKITSETNKEISVYINRRGKVVDVAVGNETSVSLQDLSERRSEEFLNGIRCIHTHPNGNGTLSNVDITALINLKFDMMVAIGVVDGFGDNFSVGVIDPMEGKLSKETIIEGPFKIEAIDKIDVLSTVSQIEERLYDKIYTNLDNEEERSILVGTLSEDMYSSEESLEELEELTKTAGAIVVKKVIQNKSKIDSSYYIGTGKVQEISLMRQELMATTVIFDDELSGAQVRNLEEALGCKVIDRTTLILDIFAQRAISREGKLQVELAQLKYRLPRLIGSGGALSRTGGGIGTRGPGEKKLELDKRRIKREILDLQKQLQEVKKTRQLQRERRKSREIPVISLVGYTNVGKSTIRNKLCDMAGVEKEKVLEANMLFATLDTTTRAIELPSGKECLISDTVGFIRKLPHDLVEAFKSTLEEILFSDLVLHVVDASSENTLAQIETVNKVLKEIGAENKETILVLNKIDIANKNTIEKIAEKYDNIISISAKEGKNLDELLKYIEESVYKKFIRAEMLIPYTDTRVISYLHNNKCVESEEYVEEGIKVVVNTTEDVLGRVREFIVN